MELKRNLSLAAYLSARKTYLQRKRRYLQARRVYGFPDSLVLFNLICIEVDVLTLYLSFEIRETMNAILYLVALVLSGSHIVSCFSARDEIPFRFHEIFPAQGAIQPGLRRPLHMSPVTGLTRLPGRILWYVHMRNLSPVHRDDFKKVGKVGHRDLGRKNRDLGNRPARLLIWTH